MTNAPPGRSIIRSAAERGHRLYVRLAGAVRPGAPASAAGHDARPRVAFLLEQTLGHVTHGANLRASLRDSPILCAQFVDIEPSSFPLLRRLPLLSNWTVRAGLRARQALAGLRRRAPLAALFVHTQVPAVLLGRSMVRTPTIVSLDATPLQYDRLGEFYAHQVGLPSVERWKKRANERCFERARHIIAWSDWTRDGLIDEYGIAASKITVIAPGVDVATWQHGAERPADGPLRILFVGGDLGRKGGDLLMSAFADIRASADLAGEIELHLVTRSEVPVSAGVVVHRLGPNDPALIDLYATCNIFCLPTLGDCLPMVLSEASAASMAIISTSVGAIHEIVRDGVTGLLIPPADVPALEAALRRLIVDVELRERLGNAARELTERRFDAVANADRIARLLADIAIAPAGRGPSAPLGAGHA